MVTTMELQNRRCCASPSRLLVWAFMAFFPLLGAACAAGHGGTPTATALTATSTVPRPAATPTTTTPVLTMTPSQAPTSTSVSRATPTASPTGAPRRTSDFVERPLADLSPAAAAFLETREGPRGVAVVVPSQGVVYSYNGDELTPMASVAKVAIMVTVMDRAIREKRTLTDWELSMLRPMITVSDNDSASALWEYVGGGATVEETLRSMGLLATKPNPMEAWGASRSTPKEVALLLAKIALGEILDEPNRELALNLMGQVDPSQTWGITSGVPTDQPLHADIAIKDGWNPTQGGWWVNSAGLVMPLSTKPMYALAVLTRQQPSMEYGIATIEGVASRVHAALHSQVTPTAVPTP